MITQTVLAVMLFTQPGCPPCYDAKTWLEKHNVSYVECNILLKNCRAKFDSYGGYGTPLVVINGQVVQGYKPTEMARLLGK